MCIGVGIGILNMNRDPIPAQSQDEPTLINRVEQFTWLPFSTGSSVEGLRPAYWGTPVHINIPREGPHGYTVRVGALAFQNRTNIVEVTIPNTVTTIQVGAFANNNLETLSIPNSVTSIVSMAFQNNNLTTLDLPNSVTTIGNSAFFNNNLTTLTLPNSLTTIGGSAFSDNNLTTLTLPDSLTSIGPRAFENNTDDQGVGTIRYVFVPSSVVTIGLNAFSPVAPNAVFHTDVANQASAPWGWHTDSGINGFATHIWGASGPANVENFTVNTSPPWGVDSIVQIWRTDNTITVLMDMSQGVNPAYYSGQIFMQPLVGNFITLPSFDATREFGRMTIELNWTNSLKVELVITDPCFIYMQSINFIGVPMG